MPRQRVEVRRQPRLQLEVHAVDRGVRFAPRPGLLVGVAGPPAHDHHCSHHALVLEIAGVRVWRATKDAVDVAAHVGHRREAGSHKGGDLPPDVVPAARVISRPHHGVPVRARPPVDSPDEAPTVRVLLNPVADQLHRVERVLVPSTDPPHIRLTDADARAGDFPGDVGQTRRRPQSSVEAPFVQLAHHVVQVVKVLREAGGRLAKPTAVPVVREEPRPREVAVAILVGHGNHQTGRVAVPLVVVAVRVAKPQTVHRHHERWPRDLRVRCKALGKVARDKVRVKPRLLVASDGRGICREVVRPTGPRVPVHAVAPRRDVKGDGVGIAAVGPVVRGGDQDAGPLVREGPVLHPASEERLLRVGFDGLRRAVHVPREGARILPQRVATAVEHREEERRLVCHHRDPAGHAERHGIRGRVHRGLDAVRPAHHYVGTCGVAPVSIRNVGHPHPDH
mmetsp:Transcript_30703/g.80367  ORF Transcript_30703/g.80367 Transcript_30703/m.80367 type:complete len:451 (+) Transcript_30703:3287-4639(+)